MAHTLNSQKASVFRILRQTRSFMNSFPVRSKKVPEEAIPKNLLQEYYTSHKQPNGVVYDKRPFRLTLEAGKVYKWCNCGQSKSQPLCDGTHKIFNLGIKQTPVLFKVAETKEYWLCNCKQSEHKPFCDGTHLNEEIQAALRQPKF